MEPDRSSNIHQTYLVETHQQRQSYAIGLTRQLSQPHRSFPFQQKFSFPFVAAENITLRPRQPDLNIPQLISSQSFLDHIRQPRDMHLVALEPQNCQWNLVLQKFQFFVAFRCYSDKPLSNPRLPIFPFYRAINYCHICDVIA